MSFVAARRALLIALSCTLIAACGGRGSSAPPPVGGITVTPGDAQVVITWTPDPGVEYWLFYAPTASISKDDLSAAPGHRGVTNVTSPYVLAGLTNGQLYSFTIDGRYDGGPGGPGTPSVSAIPRVAGATWQAGAGLGAVDMRGVAYGKASDAIPYYVAVGAAGAIYRSSDSVTSASLSWSPLTSGATANLRAVTYLASKFVAVGESGSAYYSSDALNWTAGATGATQHLNALATDGTRMVAVGDAGTILYSLDGASWTPTAAPAGTTANLLGVSYASSGLWLAVGQGGTVLKSTDSVNWTAVATGSTADLTGAAFRPAKTTTITLPTPGTTTTAAAYVLVGAGGVVLSSPDAVSWTVQTSNTASDLLAVSPLPNQFLALGAGGVALTSPDGLTWTAQTTGSASALYGVANGQGQYVAVGQAGTNLYSR